MVLLIHDDRVAIASIERLLARAGREVKVASTVDDAVAAFRAEVPSVILLAPSIESGRGNFVLEELVATPKARSVPVLLLGEAAAGFDHPITPMPPGDVLLEQLDRLAPPPSIELLAGAERALSKVRSDAAALRQASKQTGIELAAQLAAANEELEHVREERSALDTSKQDLETKLGELQREHAQTQDALATLSREHAEALSRRDALKTKLDAALERAQQRSKAATDAETELKKVRESAAAQATEGSALADQVLRLEAELAAAAELAQQADLSAAAEQLAEQADGARRQLETAREAHRIETTTLKARHDEQLTELRRDAEGRLAELQVQLDGARAASQLDASDRAARDAELEQARFELAEARAAHEAERVELTTRLAGAGTTHDTELAQARAAHADELAEASKRVSALHAAHDDAIAATRERAETDRRGVSDQLEQATAELSAVRAAAQAEREAAAAALEAAGAATEATKAEHAAERARGQAALLELETVRLELQTARAQVAGALTALTAERDRAAAAEHRAAEASERARSIESRTHLITEAESDTAPLAISRSGTVAMGELARLAIQLWAARADVRLDLSIAGGTRRLWLRRGALVAAWSSLRTEGLSVRARRDGLIDARAEAELREVRDASAASLLEELRQRGLVRKGEVAGLVKRYAEEIALEAFSEAVCTYRLHDEAPGAEVPIAEDTRLLPTIAAQALKRSLPWEAQLELIGGPEAVPRLLGGAIHPEVLGLNERERGLLDAVDGETTIESLIVDAGLKSERGYQVFAVAKVAGLIAVGQRLEGDQPPPRADPDSLDAMYEQIQQTDYFAILGLPRTAGADDVRQARERLAKQYDPLRWSGHPDPSLLRRAQVVFESIEEAARTLQDDRLRAEYARHLKE